MNPVDNIVVGVEKGVCSITVCRRVRGGDAWTPRINKTYSIVSASSVLRFCRLYETNKIVLYKEESFKISSTYWFCFAPAQF